LFEFEEREGGDENEEVKRNQSRQSTFFSLSLSKLSMLPSLTCLFAPLHRSLEVDVMNEMKT